METREVYLEKNNDYQQCRRVMYQTAFFYYTLFASLKKYKFHVFPFLGGSNIIYSSKPLNITDSTEGNIEKVKTEPYLPMY